MTQVGKTGLRSHYTGSWLGWEAACAVSAIFFAAALVLHLLCVSLGEPELTAPATERAPAKSPPKRAAMSPARAKSPAASARKTSPKRASPKTSPERRLGGKVASTTSRRVKKALDPYE